MLFLAGGLAFNVVLALVPFVLLIISGSAFFLGQQPEAAAQKVLILIQSFLPESDVSGSELLRSTIVDVLTTRGTVGVGAAIGFAWFSTRLFGSLRGVLARIFDGTDRGIVAGKLFDFAATIVATVVVVLYLILSFYIDLASTRGIELLVRLGLRENAMGLLTSLSGRALAIALMFGLFYALYRGLPRHRPSVRTAIIAASASTALFELARYVFAWLVRHVDPSSLYTGTIAAIVAVVFWVYYGSLLFLIGGEIAQAVELRRRDVFPAP